jgi:hypothetical protein
VTADGGTKSLKALYQLVLDLQAKVEALNSTVNALQGSGGPNGSTCVCPPTLDLSVLNTTVQSHSSRIATAENKITGLTTNTTTVFDRVDQLFASRTFGASPSLINCPCSLTHFGGLLQAGHSISTTLERTVGLFPAVSRE